MTMSSSQSKRISLRQRRPNAEKFVLHLTREELDILGDAMHEYMEYYQGKTLASSFSQAMRKTKEKLDNLG